MALDPLLKTALLNSFPIDINIKNLMRNQILKINKGTGDEILGTNNMKMKQRNIYALSHLFSFPIINHIWQYCGLMKKIFWNEK